MHKMQKLHTEDGTYLHFMFQISENLMPSFNREAESCY